MERKNKYSPSNTLPLYYKITSTNLQLKAENSIISSGFKKFEKHWKDSWTSWLQFVAIMTPCWVKHEHWPSLARSRTEEYYNISSIFPVWTPRDLTICSYSHITLNNFIKLEIYVQNLFILINFNVKVNYVEKLNLYCLNFIRDMRIQKIHLSSISFFYILHFIYAASLVVSTWIGGRFLYHYGGPETSKEFWLLSPSNGGVWQGTSLYANLLGKELSYSIRKQRDEGFLELKGDWSNRK